MKKSIIIALSSLLLSMLTYHLPFIVNQKFEINSLEVERPKEIDNILKKNEYTEDDYAVLKKYSDTQLESSVKIDVQKSLKQFSIREGTVHWVTLVWLVFFLLLANRKVEYFVAIVFPLIGFSLSLILGVEFLVIISAAIFSYLIKANQWGQTRLKSRK